MVLLLFLWACAAPTERFARTHQACMVEVSADCEAYLTEDFSVEGQAPDWWWSGARELLRVSAAMDTMPTEDEHTHHTFIDWFADAPGQTPGARLYNQITFETAATRFGDIGVAANSNGGEVVWQRDHIPPQSVASLMLHEAAHGRVGHRHIACPPGHPHSTECDEDWSGSYAFEASFTHWAAGALPADEAGAYLWRRDILRTLVLAD